MLENNHTIHNPPDMRFFLMIIIISFFAFLLGVMDFLYLNGDLFGIVLMTLISIAGTSTITYREFIHRPVSLFIQGNGIILDFRFLKSRSLPWNEILWINAKPGDVSTIIGRWERIGLLQPTRGNPYPLTYEIAISIRESYRNQNGSYPMTRDEYRNVKKN